MRRGTLALVALLATASAVALPGPWSGALHAATPPAVNTAILAGPLATATGYTTPVAVVSPLGGVTFLNLDVVHHDVTSNAYGPDTQPWCNANPEAPFPPGECPLFWTPLLTGGQSSPVLGLEHVQAGVLYTFYCSIHEWMEGTLTKPLDA